MKMKPKFLKLLYKEYKMLISEYDRAVYMGYCTVASDVAGRIEVVKKQIKEEEI